MREHPPTAPLGARRATCHSRARPPESASSTDLVSPETSRRLQRCATMRSCGCSLWPSSSRPCRGSRGVRQPRRRAPRASPLPCSATVKRPRSWTSRGRRSARGIVGEVPGHPVSTAPGSCSAHGLPWAFACRGRRTPSLRKCRRFPSTKFARATSFGGRGTWAFMPAMAGWSRRSTGATASFAVPQRVRRIVRSARSADIRSQPRRSSPPRASFCSHRA